MNKKSKLVIIIAIIIISIVVITKENFNKIKSSSKKNDKNYSEQSDNKNVSMLKNDDLKTDENIYKNANDANINSTFEESKTLNSTSDNLQVSNGVNIEYLDMNTNKMISVPEKLYGVVNQNYDVENLEKNINNYVLVSTIGEKKGKLKKERINIIYNFAKKSILNVRYIDKENENDVKVADKIEGYQGKEINISIPNIKGYTYVSGNNNIVMNEGEVTAKLYYNKLAAKTNNFNNNKSDEQSIIPEMPIKKSTIVVKYVDIEDDKLLDKEVITKNIGQKVKINLKRIEGYKLISNEYNDNNENNKTGDINKNEKNESNESKSIIDELIESLAEDDNDKVNNKNLDANNKLNEGSKVKEKDIKSEYEIVMNCDDSEYIIYYKKI